MEFFSNGMPFYRKVIAGYEPLEALIAPKLLTKQDPSPSRHTFIGKNWLRAVKLTGFFILIACLQVSARTNAQRLTISLKNSPLEKLFNEIEQKTNYVFFYDVAILKDSKPVTVEVHDASVEDVLKTALKGQALEFSVNDKTVFIKKEINPTPHIEATSGGGTYNITMVVHSETGTPLAGATVTIKKLNKQAVTDAKGECMIKDVPNGNYKIEVTFVGYEINATEITIADHDARGMAGMKQSSSNLDQVVFKGYYSTTNRLNTGDVTKVKGEDLQKQPVSDPILALEGRVPGLSIQQTSGIPGAYSAVQIRGRNSIGQGGDPLYIVDGVPFSSVSLTSTFFGGGAVGRPSSSVSNVAGALSGGAGMSPFNSINPYDIESIEVLKDADATAIYGSRGANGVVLITTRKGKSGNTRFDLDMYTGAGKVTRMMNMLNTRQYLEMRREAFKNDGLTVPSIIITPKDNNYDINGFWDTTRYTNWQKVLIGNTANFTNLQGSLSGGTANTQFVFTGGYSDQGTVYPGNYSDKKVSAHFSLIHASADQRFHALFTTNYVNDNSKLPLTDFTNFITLAPDAPAVYLADGSLNWQPLNGSATWSNPIAYTATKSLAVTNNLISNAALGYRFLDDLELRVNLGYSHTQMNQNILTPAITFAPPNNNNSANRSNKFATTDFQTWIIEPQLNYKRKISEGHLDILLGTTIQENVQNSVSQTASGFTSDALISNPVGATTLQFNSKTYTLYHYDALFGRVSYDWQEKYLINFTARRDGSSRFGPSKQFGDFGALGIGWVFSNERFAQNALPVISFGKIRASYGTTGNDQIVDYQYLSTYTPLSATYQNISGLSPTQLANPYFGWETVKKLEGGLELGILKNRILVSASYYRNRTGNQLVGYTLPALTGFTIIQYNLPAVVQNSGAEFTISSVNIKSSNFTWTTSANFTLPANKLIAYPNLAVSSNKNNYIIGQPLSTARLYYSSGVNSQTGVYSFATKNASGIPSTPQDLVATKNLAPISYGGIQNSFFYKSIQLDFLIQFVHQFSHNYMQSFNPPGITNFNQPSIVLSRWQKSGDNTKIQEYTQNFGSAASTAYFTAVSTPTSTNTISDASFLRVKNVAISYQLPIGLQKKAHLQNLKIYIEGQNLFTVTKFLGLDPETGGGLGLPPLKMITAGLHVSL